MPTKPTPTLTMLINREGFAWPATAADRKLLRRKLATRAGAPYAGLPARVDYLVGLAVDCDFELAFRPTRDAPPPPLPAPSPLRT